MDQMWKFEAEDGWHLCLRLEKENHCLRLEAEHDGCLWKLYAQDMLDNTEDHPSSFCLETQHKGRFWLFHEGTKVEQHPDGITLHTCPVNCETKAPVPALMVHYRIQVKGAQISARTSFAAESPWICHTLHWMQWKLYGPGCDRIYCFGPDCVLPNAAHSLRFGSVAVARGQAWAAMGGCGEALWTPESKGESLTPEWIVSSSDAAQDESFLGTLSPIGCICPEMDISLANESRPLQMTLSFGTGTPCPPAEGEKDGTAQPLPRGRMERLKSGSLEAAVAVREDGLTLMGLSLTDGRADETASILPLTRLTVRKTEDGSIHTFTSERGWRHVRVANNETIMRIWLDGPGDICDLSVSVEARACPCERIEWRVRVLNANPAYSVLSATYPGTSFAGGDAVLFEPSHSGSLILKACEKGYAASGAYPSGFQFTMPVFGAYSEAQGNGLYVAVHDRQAMRKQMRVQCFPNGQGTFEFEFPAIHMGVPATAFSLAGCLVWQRFQGDWYDMAQIYRTFVQTAPWFAPHGRPDSPAWMRDVPLYIMDWMPNDNPDADPVPISIRPAKEPPRDAWVRKPIELADALGVPIGYHLYNWHWIPFNNDFPHYFPVKEGLREGVEALHCHQVHVMPYINGRLWDTHDCRGDVGRYATDAAPSTAKAEDGSTYTESYASHEPDGRLAELAVMCPQSAIWRRELAAIVKRLANEYVMDAVYIDQVAAANANLCCDPTHAHPSGNGDWWVESYRLLMERLRSEAPEGFGFTTECNAEPYADQFDGFLTWVWIMPNLVPFFPAVYAGRIAMLGRNTNGYKKQDLPYFRFHLAQAVLFGQQMGWINADVVDDAEKMSFLKEMTGLRWKYRDFFSHGDMLRPPKLEGENPHFLTDTGMGYSIMFDAETLLAGAWRRRRDQSVLMMLINVGDTEQEAQFAFDWEAAHAAYDGARQDYGQGRVLSLDSDGIRCLLPPHTCVALLVPQATK